MNRLLGANEQITSDIPVKSVALTDIIDAERARCLQMREAYYRCTQHDHKAYDFDGHILRFGEDNVDVLANGYISMRRRKPSVRMDLPKIIVDRLTALVFGHEHFPTIQTLGDPIAEDFVSALADAAKLQIRMVEARNMGGATGTAVLSWAFVNGKPLVEVHQSAHIEVIEWRDYDRRKPGKVVKTYPYQKRVWTSDGKPKEVTFYYARYWDDNSDITWREIPEEAARTKAWWRLPAEVVHHGTGYTPVYWIQNLPDSSSIDGISDFENQEDDCDAIDALLSATQKGTVANVDPTLLIKDDPGNNDGVIHKGSSHAIYSRNGAEYIELSGTSIQTSLDLLERLRRYEFDKASVVMLDPESLTGAGISAAAMRTRYAPMLAKADLLREQYGDAIVDILDDMVAVARKLGTVQTDEDGTKYWSQVSLPPKIIEERGEDGEKVTQIIERAPGSGGQITLAWPPYFQATWLDRKEAVTAVREASGKQQVMSQRTAVQAISPLFETDVDDELEKIEEDASSMNDRAKDLLRDGAPMVDLQGEEDVKENPKEGEFDDKDTV
jgi:hypothetical protein